MTGFLMNIFLKILKIFVVFALVFTACSCENEKFVTVTPPECDDDDYSTLKYTKNTKGDAERTISEADIYKLDGNILWLVNLYKGLVAVDISDPANMKILDSLRLGIEESISGIYLQNGRAYIIADVMKKRDESGKIRYIGREITRIIVINTEDPSNLSLVTELEMEGEFIGAVQVENIIYVATEEKGYSWTDCNGKSGEAENNQYKISIVSINIKDPQNTEIVDRAIETYSFDEYESIGMGKNSRTFYVSQKSVYIAKDALDETLSGRVAIFDISDSDGKIVKKADLKTMGFTEHMHEAGNIFFAVSNGIIESFDVSDPENIKRLGRSSQYNFETAKFDGDIMYAVIKTDYSDHRQLYVFDISDPGNITEFGKVEMHDSEDNYYLDISGTTLLAFGRYGYNSTIYFVDVTNPQNPRIFRSILASGDYNDSNFTIFDELGLILYPYGCTVDLFYFDLGSTGTIWSAHDAIKALALNDLVFVIDFKNIAAADINNRYEPEVLSELSLIFSAPEHVYDIMKCGKFLCGIHETAFVVYDEKTLEKIWESSSIKGNFVFEIVKNDRYAYIYKESAISIIKFSEDGKFEEVGNFPIAISDYSSSLAVSENNVIAKGSNNELETALYLFDMNNPKTGIKQKTFNFDYRTLLLRQNVVVSGNTFWTSGCKLKKKDLKKGDRYYCYALSFDVSDPSNPKAGKKINIPGEIIGVSDDGNYLYTLTPEIDKNLCDYRNIWDTPYYGEYELYILRLNNDKTSVSVVAREALTHSGMWPFIGDTADLIYVKNNKVFLVKRSLEHSEEDICYDGTDRDDNVRIISADTGKEIYNKQFKNTNFAVNVIDGGLLVSTLDGWTYIFPDGKEKSGYEDISSFSEAEFQLVNETICISTEIEGLLSLDVK